MIEFLRFRELNQYYSIYPSSQKESRPKRTWELKKWKPNVCSKLKITNQPKWTKPKHFYLVLSMIVCLVVETLMLFSMLTIIFVRERWMLSTDTVDNVINVDLLPPSPLFSHPGRHRKLQTAQWTFQGSLWFLPSPYQHHPLSKHFQQHPSARLALGQWQSLCCSLALCLLPSRSFGVFKDFPKAVAYGNYQADSL